MKAIKSVGHAVSRAFKAVGSAISKFAHSTVGKVIIAAVAIYLTAGLASGYFAAAEAASVALPAAVEGETAWAMTDAAITAAEQGAAEGGLVSTAGVDAGVNAASSVQGDILASTGAEGQSVAAQELAGTSANAAPAAPDAASAGPAQADYGPAMNNVADASATPPPTGGPPAPTGAQAPGTLPEATTTRAGGGIVDSVMNGVDKAADWYKGLSGPGQMAVGQAVAGAGTASVSAIAAREAEKAKLKAEADRQRRNAVPDMTYMYQRPGLVRSAMGG